MYHLYEIVLDSPQMWLKLQASASSEEYATAFFEHRFGGNDPDPLRPDLRYISFSFRMPRKLSECVDHISNWESVKGRLPDDWDLLAFRLAEGPYPWCETQAADCDCYGSKGTLDLAYCSDLGLPDETAKRASKSPNTRHAAVLQAARRRLTSRQATERGTQKTASKVPGLPDETAKRASKSPNTRHAAVLQAARRRLTSRQATERGTQKTASKVPAEPSAQDGCYCQVHGRYHAYSEKVRQATEAELAAWRSSSPEVSMARAQALSPRLLRNLQARECAISLVEGRIDVPGILYKYIPRELLGKGPPTNLRATQLSALNDDMECNVITTYAQEIDILDVIDLVQSRVKECLGLDISSEVLVERALRHVDLRLSTFIQEYLNPRVGVVSLSTNVLVPTMWSHYARNTGVVVGYEAEALRGLGFELRQVSYSDWPPEYAPAVSDAIQMVLSDREQTDRNARSVESVGWVSFLAKVPLTELGAGWRSLSRLLFVKGSSWESEQEVRLLVDLRKARDTGKVDSSGLPIKVVDIPPEAIKEIYGGENTRQADLRQAAVIVRGDNRRRLFVGHVASHAYRIQKTGGAHY